MEIYTPLLGNNQLAINDKKNATTILKRASYDKFFDHA